MSKDEKKSDAFWRVRRPAECNRSVNLLLSSEVSKHCREQAFIFPEFLNVLKTPFRKSGSDRKRLVHLKWKLDSKQKKSDFERHIKPLEIFMPLNDVA